MKRQVPLNFYTTSLFFISGAIGLAYELIWIRLLALQMGHSAWAISTVVGIFMGGLALGSWYGGKWADKIKRPYRIYALLEIGIASYGLAAFPLLSNLAVVLRPVYQTSNHHFYLFSLFRAFLASLVLILPTLLMGITLPVLIVGVARVRNFEKTVGWLYGINTLGAAIGVLLVGFWFFPVFGLEKTLVIIFSLGLFVSALAFLLDQHVKNEIHPDQPAQSHLISKNSSSWAQCLAALAFVCGFLGIFYEICWTRLLAPILGSSTYAFSIILATFLIGIGIGGSMVSRPLFAKASFRAMIGGLLGIISFGGIVSLVLVNLLPGWFIFLSNHSQKNLLLFFIIQGVISGLLVLIPAICFGLILPLSIIEYKKEMRIEGESIGKIYTSNTIGSILGSLLSGFVFLPCVGVRSAILGAVVFGLLIALSLIIWDSTLSRDRKTLWLIGSAALFLIVLMGGPSVDYQLIYGNDTFLGVLTKSRLSFNRNEKILFVKDGTTCTLTVHRSGNKGNEETWFKSNGRGEASTKGDLPTQYLLGHIPLLLTNNPRRVAIIGLGSGSTAHAVATHPVQSIDIAEIEPAMIDIQPYFRSINENVLADPRVRLRIEDGRTLLQYSPHKFDVIISQPSHPWVDGVSSLFTSEFYRVAQDHLENGGVLCQWIQGFLVTQDTLNMMISTLNDVFKYVVIFNLGGDLICVASETPMTPDFKKMHERIHSPEVQESLKRISLSNEFKILNRVQWILPKDKELFLSNERNNDETLKLAYRTPREMYLNTRLTIRKSSFASLDQNIRLLFGGTISRDAEKRLKEEFDYRHLKNKK